MGDDKKQEPTPPIRKNEDAGNRDFQHPGVPRPWNVTDTLQPPKPAPKPEK